MNRQDAGDEAVKAERGGRLALLLPALLLLVFLILVFMTRGDRQAKANGLVAVPFSLHSYSEADYSADPTRIYVPGVSLAILGDLLRDQPGAQNVPERVATLEAQFETPVPTATLKPGETFIPALTATQAPTRAPTSGGTLLPTTTVQETAQPSPTASKVVIIIPTNTSTPVPTASATSRPPNTATSTVEPVATRTPTATKTSTPTATKTSTPTASKTPTPTASHSPTPTASYTPTPDPTLEPTALVTDTLTPTPPPDVTDTSTPTPSFCRDPDPLTGFVLSISPSYGSTGVSTSVHPVIRFNQAMDASSLTYGDERHIALLSCLNERCNQAEVVSAAILVETLSYANDQVTVIPTEPLVANWWYVIVVGNQVQNHPDCGGANQSGRYYGPFTTGAE